MRCSKCQYIGFDNSDRCRNCGYEFSLAAGTDELDLPLKTGEELSGPLSDFPLSDPDAVRDGTEPQQPPAPRQSAGGARREPSSQAARSRSSADLPLFHDRGRDADAPLVSLPASPRAPVAVRKSTTLPRQRQPRATTEPELDLALTGGDDEPELSRVPGRAEPSPPVAAAPAEEAVAAPLVRRILGAVIDLTLLAGIDAVILYFTLKLSGLEFSDAHLIPVVPFAAFLTLLNGGYVASFTAAGGQTIGKMLTGIKVVTSEESASSDRVPVESAALRAVGYLISALPAGLGFLPVFVGPARRGLHDRLAHTRVVRA